MPAPTLPDLPFQLERDLVVCATRATVWRYLTEPEPWAAWLGAGSHIDPREGGAMFIRYPNAQTAQGTVLSVTPPERIVMTFGFDRPEPPIPVDGSRLTVALEEVAGGTRIHLRHDVTDEKTRDMLRAGWRYQLAVLADALTRDQHAGVPAAIELWLGAWSSDDDAARTDALTTICTPDVVFRDRWGYTTGVADLASHIRAARSQLHATLVADGAVEHAQGIALVRWRAVKDGTAEPLARGTTVFELAPDSRIARATGLWA
jgi:uncharacterized protein YndB with AHSA1/START domain